MVAKHGTPHMLGSHSRANLLAFLTPSLGFYAALNPARNAFVRNNIDHPKFPAALIAIYRNEQVKGMRGLANTIHGLRRSDKSG